MEDDDEIDSPPPPPPSHPNGRLTVASQPVTVATAPPHQTLTLALPIQQPRIGGSVIGVGAGSANVHHGREDCWSEGATATLIDAWGERYLELSRGNLKQKHWKDVSDAVSSREDYTKTPKTDIQCKNRIDTLKKKYKLEKAKIANGSGPSKWTFFNTVDRLIGANLKTSNSSADHHPQPPPLKIRRSIDRTLPGPGTGAGGDSESFPGTDSTDSLPPEVGKGRKRVGRPIEDLTRAILRFGEVYERIERSKLDRAVEMEKQRMGFVKEVELQRMQFYMKTQLELTQLKHGGRFRNNSNNKG
eukprot:TRINITY_DN1402_c0_g1_i1.p1 TRINITY_DN1402_c0_g1~~TRINITY_DN1402_c0_g1_i1.p1  ORF type:complete len:302 (+),score=9.96 TRINITY_DN1402_c0_g1_i1:424-1329(+)